MTRHKNNREFLSSYNYRPDIIVKRKGRVACDTYCQRGKGNRLKEVLEGKPRGQSDQQKKIETEIGKTQVQVEKIFRAGQKHSTLVSLGHTPRKYDTS